jgi:ribosomal-protein-alanine N-acetyltransferase
MEILKDHKIQTNRCLLRIVSKEDIPHVFSASRVKGFTDGMLWEPPERESELEEAFERSIKRWEMGTAYSFTIEDKLSKSFIGRISIRKEDTEENLWDIGFWTHPVHQNKGYMSEVLPPVIDFGFAQLNAENVQACHAKWNKASQAVLENAGMKFVRSNPEGFKKRGQWVEENILSISKSDWIEAHNKIGATER